MKAFIFDLADKLQRSSNSLDAKAILCNKTWRVFSDSGEKEVYIFMEDGKLVISVNGTAVIGSWMYIPANHSLVISGNNQNFLVHPIVCNNAMVLVLDGSMQCCFLLDSTKKELESIHSLQNMKSYISKNTNIIPRITKNEEIEKRNINMPPPLTSDAVYMTDPRLKFFDLCYWNHAHTVKTCYKYLYIKGSFTYKKFTGYLYSSQHHLIIGFIGGQLYSFSQYYSNYQIAKYVENINNDNEISHYYDENGNEISEEEYDSLPDSLMSYDYSEFDEFESIEDGGEKFHFNSRF